MMCYTKDGSKSLPLPDSDKIHLDKFNLELKEIKPEDVIAGYQAAQAVSIKTLFDGFLKSDDKKTLRFVERLSSPSIEDEKTLSGSAKMYFQDILSLEEKEIYVSVFANRTARELVMLGLIYLYGLGVPNNLKVAFYFLKLSANQGDCYGITYVGICNGIGIGTDIDMDASYENLVKAALNLNAVAIHRLTSIFDESLSHDATLNSYATAATIGYAPALHNLGIIYREGYLGVKVNPNIASQLFAASALKGYTLSLDSYSSLMFDDKL